MPICNWPDDERKTMKTFLALVLACLCNVALAQQRWPGTLPCLLYTSDAADEL